MFTAASSSERKWKFICPERFQTPIALQKIQNLESLCNFSGFCLKQWPGNSNAHCATYLEKFWLALWLKRMCLATSDWVIDLELNRRDLYFFLFFLPVLTSDLIPYAGVDRRSSGIGGGRGSGGCAAALRSYTHTHIHTYTHTHTLLVCR
jgi:hypothetical protein